MSPLDPERLAQMRRDREAVDARRVAESNERMARLRAENPDPLPAYVEPPSPVQVGCWLWRRSDYVGGVVVDVWPTDDGTMRARVLGMKYGRPVEMVLDVDDCDPPEPAAAHKSAGQARYIFSELARTNRRTRTDRRTLTTEEYRLLLFALDLLGGVQEITERARR